jgi:carbon storage regulator
MLVITRHCQERIRIGKDIWITLVDIKGPNLVKLGIEAPREVEVTREELLPPEERRYPPEPKN